jgi:hypothetical protein
MNNIQDSRIVAGNMAARFISPELLAAHLEYWTNPEGKDLRVWWIPQIPGEPFHVEVRTLREAYLLTKTLAAYDLFQLEHKIKPDYSNAGGVQEYLDDADEAGWLDYSYQDLGDLDDLIKLLKENGLEV